MADKIRIAFVGGDSVPLLDVRGGAIQTLVTALIRENEKKYKCSIDVYTCDDPLLYGEEKKYRYTTIIPIRKRLFQNLYNTFWRIIRKISKYHLESHSAFMNQVNRYINNEMYDFVIFESTERQVREYKKNNSAKMCFHVHAAFLDSKNTQTNKLISKCDIMIGVSDFISKGLGVTGKTPRVVTLENAIDVAAFSLARNGMLRAEKRREYGFSKQDTVVVYCSRLSKEKGCLELIKAITKTEYKLLIIGGENFSSNKNTPYTEELRKSVEDIRDRVVFTGYIQHKDIPKCLSAADIGVVPSICDEAASLTLVEMHAAGLPVIASNRGGIPEYSSQSNTIYIETDDDFVDNMASAISKLANNKSLYDDMKNHSLEDMDRFDYSSYYDRFVSLLGKMMER